MYNSDTTQQQHSFNGQLPEQIKLVGSRISNCSGFFFTSAGADGGGSGANWNSLRCAKLQSDRHHYYTNAEFVQAGCHFHPKRVSMQ